MQVADKKELRKISESLRSTNFGIQIAQRKVSLFPQECEGVHDAKGSHRFSFGYRGCLRLVTRAA
jgi:hypothetical protein